MCIRDSIGLEAIDGIHMMGKYRFIQYVHIQHATVEGCMECTIPVSYTHLDVYKRQFQRSRWSMALLPYVNRLRYVDGSAVSYTHLDVYKRQAFEFHRTTS